MDDVEPLILSSLLSSDQEAPSGNLVAVAVRLATTCREDSAEAIADAVTELVRAFHVRNDIGPMAVRIAVFTATHDLRAAKPAGAARVAGWTKAQFLCLAEMPTDSDLPRCIRVLVIVDRARGADTLHAVYLNGTQSLRPDLKFD